MRVTTKINIKFFIFFTLLISNVLSQDKIESLESIEVIGVSPLPGLLIDKDLVPNSTQTLKEQTLKYSLSKSFVDTMGEELNGVSVKDVQNGSFQRNIDYRGFTASPLLGESQGLAVYLNSIRINEGFGDTVQWELIPENAIKSIQLMSSNPVFGLNALGGSIALSTKKGIDYIGIGLPISTSVKGGSFGYNSELVEFGKGAKNSGIYSSFEIENDGGWRDFSQGKIKRSYTNLGFMTDSFDISTSLLGAKTDVNGNGVVPVELLDIRRESVFTHPDKTQNDLLQFGSEGTYYFENNNILNLNFYIRNLTRRTINGDEVDAEECAEDDASDAAELQSDYGFDDSPLCGEENSNATGYGVLLDQDGNAIESDDTIRKYGLMNKTFTRTISIGGSLQYDLVANIFKKEHRFLVGTSYDRSRTKFRSRAMLGKLENNRSITQLYNSADNFIELAGEAEHEGAGADADDPERGDVGPAEVYGKLDNYSIYFSDNFEAEKNLTYTTSARANVTFVELVDELKPIYTRTETVNGDHRYFRFNPSLGFTYKFKKTSIFHMNYKEVNRAPSPVELACASPTAPCRLPNAFVADPPLEQVVTKGLEVGIRDRLMTKNSSREWSIIGYFNNNYDDIIFVSSGTGLSAGYFKNFGKTNRRGFDINYSFSKEKDFGLKSYNISYSFLKATYEDSHTLPAANHPNGSNDVKIGDNIPGMPDHNFKTGFEVGIMKDFNIGMNSITTSGVYLRGDESNQLKKTSPYTIFNLKSSFLLFNKTEIFTKINNVLNSKYETMGVLGEASSDEVNVPISELGDSGSGDTAIGPLDPHFLSPGAPRSFFMGINFSW